MINPTQSLVRNCSGLLLTLLLVTGCDYGRDKTISKTYVVEIKQMEFQPSELSVHKGDTVIFMNHDMVTHDVTEESGKIWTSSELPAGNSWSLVVLESSGYYCSIHPVMKGKLLVH